MAEKLPLAAYLAGDETTRPQELAYGILREPPAPGFEHQLVVGRTYQRLDRHVRRRRAGRVVASPIDVILDAERALVVQPDVVFVSTPRVDLCQERIWGAPDLVVEVLSPGTRRHDESEKVSWFRQYGVRECWLVDPVAREIKVLDLPRPDVPPRVFEGGEAVRSAVLPGLRVRPDDVFEVWRR
jgi:Uma2 family endonuclease